jgi:hypothetical protein
MPYIKKLDREMIDPLLSELTEINLTDGDLNYIFTKLILNSLSKDKVNYQNLQNKIGMLECCKQELYRRLLSIYEDKKIVENGDVGY